MNYTLVLGLDSKHADQLRMVWPTWIKHKPSILDNPLLIFVDELSFRDDGIPMINNEIVVEHGDVTYVSWPSSEVKYEGDPNNKWTNPQRAKMLSGFIHIAAKWVKTPYWLKVDTDVVATGKDDWIEDSWFINNPAIVAQKWGYSKPPMQMLKLDQWVRNNPEKLSHWNQYPPLNLIPNPGSSLVKHERIAGWCGFYNTEFTKACSEAAESTCGVGQLPEKSQDGVMWYLAKRGNFEIIRTNFKSRGWKLRSSMKAIKQAVEEAMT